MQPRPPVSRPLRRQNRSRAPLVVLFVLIIVATVAAGLWLAHGVRTVANTEPLTSLRDAPARSEAGPQHAPERRAERASGVVSLTAYAPELSRTAAERLIAASAPSLPEGVLAERGLQLATNGFSSMRREEVDELGRLFSRAYQTLAAADREWMAVYVERLRRGLLTPEESTRGRLLLTRAVGALGEGDRSRLRSLFEQAVLVSLRAESLAAAARSRLAAATPPPGALPPLASATDSWVRREPPPVPSIPTVGIPTVGVPAPSMDAGTAQTESYWRSRMQAAKQRLAAAESRLKDLQNELSRNDAVAAGFRGEICSPHSHAAEDPAYQACLQRVQNEPLRAQARRGDIVAGIQQAEAELAAAKAGLDALPEEARRAGALPGWLRD